MSDPKAPGTGSMKPSGGASPDGGGAAPFTATDYVRLIERHRHALDGASPQEPALALERMQSSRRLSSEELVKLSLLDRQMAHFLLSQYNADQRVLSGMVSLKEPSTRAETMAAVFGPAATPPKDPASGYVETHRRYVELTRKNADPTLIAKVHLLREEMANDVARTPGQIIALGALAPDLKSAFLHDIDRADRLKTDAAAKADGLANAYVRYDTEVGSASSAKQAQAEEDALVRRMDVALRLKDDPASLFALGEKAGAHAALVAGKLGADTLAATDPAAWSRDDKDRLAALPAELDLRVGEAAKDPVARYVALQDWISRAELTGEGVRDLACLREYSRHLAGELGKDALNVGRLAHHHEAYTQHFIRDTDRTPARGRLAEPAQGHEAGVEAGPGFGNVVEMFPGERGARNDAPHAVAAEPSGNVPERPASQRPEGGSGRQSASHDAAATASGVAGLKIADPATQRRDARDGATRGPFSDYLVGSSRDLPEYLGKADSKILLLGVKDWAAGGNVTREIDKLAGRYPQRLKEIYENTLTHRDGLDASSSRHAIEHDRAEMALRAMRASLHKKGLISIDEMIKDEAPFLSEAGKRLPRARNLDPKGHIQNRDVAGRRALLEKVEDEREREKEQKPQRGQTRNAMKRGYHLAGSKAEGLARFMINIANSR